MEEYTQITLDQWMQWKEDIRRKLAETANNFVYIGFRLKQIRDSGMYGGAADVFEFAQQEYGLSKSTVSRFIAINEKYSEDGNSLELREEFRGFSSSKLSEMLTLPDAEIALINEKTTVRAIRELKQFDAEDPEQVQAAEEQINPAPAAGDVIREYTPLEKCIIDMFRTKQATLQEVLDLLSLGTAEAKRQAAELLTPSGQAFHKKGLVFLFLYEYSEGVKYKLMTEPEPRFLTWPDFLDILSATFEPLESAEAFYDALDAQSNQAKEAVATSQQEPGSGAPENAQNGVENAQRPAENAQKPEENVQKPQKTAQTGKEGSGDHENEAAEPEEEPGSGETGAERTAQTGAPDMEERVADVQAQRGAVNAPGEERAQPGEREHLGAVDGAGSTETGESAAPGSGDRETDETDHGKDQESQDGQGEPEELAELRQKAAASAEKVTAALQSGPLTASKYRLLRERVSTLGYLLDHIVDVADREELTVEDYEGMEDADHDE